MIDVEKEETLGVCRQFQILYTPIVVFIQGGVEKGRLEGVSPRFAEHIPYTGPLLSSRTIEFSAKARGACKGTSGCRKPLITMEAFDEYTSEDAFVGATSKLENLFG